MVVLVEGDRAPARDGLGREGERETAVVRVSQRPGQERTDAADRDDGTAPLACERGERRCARRQRDVTGAERERRALVDGDPMHRRIGERDPAGVVRAWRETAGDADVEVLEQPRAEGPLEDRQIAREHERPAALDVAAQRIDVPRRDELGRREDEEHPRAGGIRVEGVALERDRRGAHRLQIAPQRARSAGARVVHRSGAGHTFGRLRGRRGEDDAGDEQREREPVERMDAPEGSHAAARSASERARSASAVAGSRRPNQARS